MGGGEGADGPKQHSVLPSGGGGFHFPGRGVLRSSRGAVVSRACRVLSKVGEGMAFFAKAVSKGSVYSRWGCEPAGFTTR